MLYNYISNLRHTRIDFLRLKLGVISTAKTAHNQGANNESQKLFYKSYFAISGKTLAAQSPSREKNKEK